jgi:hypothetical protein
MTVLAAGRVSKDDYALDTEIECGYYRTMLKRALWIGVAVCGVILTLAGYFIHALTVAHLLRW